MHRYKLMGDTGGGLTLHRKRYGLSFRTHFVRRLYDFSTRRYRRAANRLMETAARQQCCAHFSVERATRAEEVSSPRRLERGRSAAKGRFQKNVRISANIRRKDVKQTAFFSKFHAPRARRRPIRSCHDTCSCVQLRRAIHATCRCV